MAQSMQSKFNKAMQSGKSLTTAQVRKIGFANPADAAYKARNAGIPVLTYFKQTKAGTVHFYQTA